jgi:hypothetical protein
MGILDPGAIVDMYDWRYWFSNHYRIDMMYHNSREGDVVLPSLRWAAWSLCLRTCTIEKSAGMLKAWSLEPLPVDREELANMYDWK